MIKANPDEGLLESDRLLTALEVARILHVSRSMIYLLIGRGELRPVHVGHALRFRTGTVQEYIRVQAEVSAARPPKVVRRRIRK